jgi:hypothetical protein
MWAVGAILPVVSTFFLVKGKALLLMVPGMLTLLLL